MSSGSGRSRRWGRSVVDDDDFSESAFTIDLMHFGVADGVLVGALALAGGDWGRGETV